MSGRCQVAIDRDGDNVIRCRNEGSYEVTSWGMPHIGEPLWCCEEHAREALSDGADVEPPVPASDEATLHVIDGWRHRRAAAALGGQS
ncbi:MAG TPA: hypothetical protein VFN70_18325 [Burkholderiales bacterium]|nr:hypothetical protein [Burkholderiales bacterium]